MNLTIEGMGQIGGPGRHPYHVPHVRGLGWRPLWYEAGEPRTKVMASCWRISERPGAALARVGSLIRA